MNTLVVYGVCDGIRLFLLNWHECHMYADCDGKYVGEDDPDDRLIMHLAILLGVEPYVGIIPSLKDFDGLMRYEGKPTTAPWADREVKGPVVNFRNVVRVIRTGWYL